ncbi:MAG: glycosyltransferase [Planctomycetes bacterium]|nr:glycosyltransferase [Planctomycetota bacterium]
MKLLVEVSQGLGNCVQGTPLCRALHLIGHEVDLFINGDGAAKFAELWRGWDVIGKVFTSPRQFKVADYDFGVSAYGRRLLTRLFPPGLCLKVERRHLRKQSETEANVEAARWLGYAGPTPQAFANKSDRKFDLRRGAVAIHAGCDPANAAKRWPYWKDVCARLKEEGRHVVVVGTRVDRSADGWENAYDAKFDLPLTDLTALLDQCEFYCGNDSGVGHLAAALGLPGVLVFQTSDPVKNAPNSKVLTPLAGDLSLESVWAALHGALTRPARDVPRPLPARVADSVAARWPRYVEMTQLQAEATGVLETENLPASFAPRISVVIPSFNRANAAMRAVQSVLNQTEKSVEVLLLDDGSTDETPRMFEQPPERVRFIRKPNGGASSARNVGLRRARGEWIALLDSDDEWTPDKLATQLAAIKPDTLVCWSRHVHVNVDGSRETKPERLPDAARVFDELYAKLSIKTSTLMFRRELIERVGLFNERFPISNDWDFFLRVAKVAQGRIAQCEQPLAIIHRSEDSISRGDRYKALEEAYTRICIINALLYGELNRSGMIERAGGKELELARAKLKGRDEPDARREARFHARQAMRGGFWFSGLWRWLLALI